MTPANIQKVSTRLLEAAIIGGLVMFGTVQVLETRLDSLAKSVEDIKADVDVIRRDFYKPRISHNQ